MDETTQQNAALVEEATAAARSMEDQSVQLAAAVAVFKVNNRAQGKTSSRACAGAAKPGAVDGSRHSQPAYAGKPTPPKALPPRPARQVSADAAHWQEF